MQKPTTTPLTISHIDYSPSGDVIMMYCKMEDRSENLWNITYDLWPSFQAWQFMLLTVMINDKIIKRSYSIATTPQLLHEQWLIGFSIKRVDDWIFSTRTTRVAQSGDLLTMTWPLWHMIDDQSFDNYLLISAGSWLSPIYSIYHDLLQSSRKIRIATIFGERKFDHILSDIHRDWVEDVWYTPSWRSTPEGSILELKGLTTKEPSNIYSQCFLSQDEHQGYYIGRVQLWLANALDRLTTTQIKIFICWSPAMVDEMRNLLIADYGIDPSYIKFEKY